MIVNFVKPDCSINLMPALSFKNKPGYASF